MVDDRSSGKHGSHHVQRQGDNDTSESMIRAAPKEGGVGGVSGTGQALPHHGFDDDKSSQTVANPVGEEATESTPETGSTYQAGGTHLNRDRQQETRKERFGGSTAASEERGGPDTAPGAPTQRG